MEAIAYNPSINHSQEKSYGLLEKALGAGKDFLQSTLKSIDFISPIKKAVKKNQVYLGQVQDLAKSGAVDNKTLADYINSTQSSAIQRHYAKKVARIEREGITSAELGYNSDYDINKTFLGMTYWGGKTDDAKARGVSSLSSEFNTSLDVAVKGTIAGMYATSTVAGIAKSAAMLYGMGKTSEYVAKKSVKNLAAKVQENPEQYAHMDIQKASEAVGKARGAQVGAGLIFGMTALQAYSGDIGSAIANARAAVSGVSGMLAQKVVHDVNNGKFGEGYMLDNVVDGLVKVSSVAMVANTAQAMAGATQTATAQQSTAAAASQPVAQTTAGQVAQAGSATATTTQAQPVTLTPDETSFLNNYGDIMKTRSFMAAPAADPALQGLQFSNPAQTWANQSPSLAPAAVPSTPAMPSAPEFNPHDYNGKIYWSATPDVQKHFGGDLQLGIEQILAEKDNCDTLQVKLQDFESQTLGSHKLLSHFNDNPGETYVTIKVDADMDGKWDTFADGKESLYAKINDKGVAVFEDVKVDGKSVNFLDANNDKMNLQVGAVHFADIDADGKMDKVYLSSVDAQKDNLNIKTGYIVRDVAPPTSTPTGHRMLDPSVTEKVYNEPTGSEAERMAFGRELMGKTEPTISYNSIFRVAPDGVANMISTEGLKTSIGAEDCNNLDYAALDKAKLLTGNLAMTSSDMLKPGHWNGSIMDHVAVYAAPENVEFDTKAWAETDPLALKVNDVYKEMFKVNYNPLGLTELDKAQWQPNENSYNMMTIYNFGDVRWFDRYDFDPAGRQNIQLLNDAVAKAIDIINGKVEAVPVWYDLDNDFVVDAGETRAKFFIPEGEPIGLKAFDNHFKVNLGVLGEVMDNGPGEAGAASGNGDGNGGPTGGAGHAGGNGAAPAGRG